MTRKLERPNFLPFYLQEQDFHLQEKDLHRQEGKYNQHVLYDTVNRENRFSVRIQAARH